MRIARLCGRGVSTRLSRAILGAIFAVPLAAGAQVATVSGSLGNFDVINDTGHDAHGFEIDLDGLQPNDVNYTFSYQRYGSPRILQTATGVMLRYESAYDAPSGTFAQATVPHVPGGPFGGTCYMGGASYATAGCEHFGVSLTANATRTVYRWLIEDPAAPGSLVPVDPPQAVAAPTYVIAPPAQVGGEPQLVAEVQAPEPAEAPELYGDAQWVKIFKTQLARDITLDELLTGNPVVPQDPSQVEVGWDIIQTEPAGAGGNQRRQRKQNGSLLDPTTRAVIRRYELYRFTGTYDPITHEALCADLVCAAPSDGELGEMVSAQMTAANVVVNAVTVALQGNGSVSSSDGLIGCGSKCGATYDAGAQVTLTAKAGSNSLFAGWSGACSGTNPTCVVAANGPQAATASFAVPVSLTAKTSGGKGSVVSAPAAIACGSTCSAKVLPGSAFTFTATPETGYRFSSWSGACSGTSTTCTATISADASVQANFTR